MTKQQLYTICNRHGAVIDAHVGLEEAAREILSYDGAEYAIEKDGDQWKLFSKSLNGQWNRRYPVETSSISDEQAAEKEMFRRVVDRAVAGEGWGAEAIHEDKKR